MPELPEVEAARRAVEENCLGKKIKKAVIANDPKVVDGVTPSDFEAALLGKTVIAAHRKGKNLWLQLDSPPFPSFQFGTLLFKNPKNILARTNSFFFFKSTKCTLFLFRGRVWSVLRFKK